METPVHRFAAAIVLPDAPRAALEALQTTYALPPWHNAIPLHITLVSPFTTHQTADALAALWLPVAAASRPFPVALEGLDRFDNDGSVLFVRVIPTAELAALAESALSAISRLRAGRSRPFVPHVTLADVAPRETVDEYVRRLQSEIIRHSFTCDRFSLLEMDGATKAWHVIRELPFQ